EATGFIQLNSLIELLLETCSFHGNVVKGDWEQRYSEFAVIIGRHCAHNELCVTVSNCDRRALNRSAIRIFHRAHDRAGDLLSRSHADQTKTQNDRNEKR